MLDISIPWLVAAIDTTLKGAALFIIALVAIRVLRVRDSNLRHRVWTGVLAGMLLLPLLSQVVPDLRLPFVAWPEWLALPDIEEPAATESPPSVATTELAEPSKPLSEAHGDAPSFTTDGQFLPLSFGTIREGEEPAGARDPYLNTGAMGFNEIPLTSPSPVESIPVTETFPELSPEPAPVLGATTPTWPTRLVARWPQLLFALWVTGMSFIGLRLYLGMLIAWRLKRASTEIAPQDLREFGVDWNSATGRRPTPVLECPLIRVPLTLGFLRPVILLPLEWLEWPVEKLEAVLSHEQTHVERGDCAVAFLSELNLCVNWLNPLVWRLRRTLSVLAEEACDDAAIGTIGDRATYARHLLEVAAAVSPRSGRLVQPGVAMARRSNVETRIDAILDFTRPLSERPTWATTLVILALATPVIGLAAALRPAGPKDAEEQVVEGNSTAASTNEPANEDARAETSPTAAELALPAIQSELSSVLALADPERGDESKAADAPTVKTERYPRRLSGHVKDVDGKPIANARIWLTRNSFDPEKATLDEVGTADASGTFSLELTPDQVAKCQESGAYANLVAQAPGYGIDVLPLEVFAVGDDSDATKLARRRMAQVDKAFGEGRAAGRTLKLRPQGEPIQGRLLDIEGKPLAGVRVAVQQLEVPDINLLIKALDKPSKEMVFTARNATHCGCGLAASQLRRLLPPVTTDATGSFTLTGLGGDQLAMLTFEGERVDAEMLHVVVREMETRRVPHLDSIPDGFKEAYVGKKFTHVLGPAVPVTGVVKDFKTGEPIPDVTVFVERLFRETSSSPNHLRLDVGHIRATTDAQGRYRLIGIPPGGKHVLNAVPPTTEPWLIASQEFSVSPDVAESTVDIQVFRGMWLEGRVTDATSGEPIEGCVDYLALQGNSNVPERFGLRDEFQFDRFPIGADGHFKTAGLPGPGVLMVRNQGKTVYPRGVGAKDVPGYDSDSNYIPTTPVGFPLSNWALIKPIDPAVDATSFNCDLTLSAGESVTGRVIGTNGQPLKKFEALHQVVNSHFWELCPDGLFKLHNYDGPGPRQMFFRSTDLSQVGQLKVEGAAPKELSVTLEPGVTVAGKLIETETNEPADGYGLYCNDTSAGEFRLEEDLTTDGDGRFTIRGLVAGLTYEIHASNRKRFNSGKNNFTIDLTSAKPGDAIELGDVTGKNVKRAKAAMAARGGPVAGGGETSQAKPSAEEPIRGRLIDTEGRPVHDADVRVVELKSADAKKLDEWVEFHRRESAAGDSRKEVMSMQRQSQGYPPAVEVKLDASRDAYAARTDADGRFEIHGVGKDSVVVLRIDKAGVATDLVDVIARKIDSLRIDSGEVSGGQRVYFGSQFDYVVEPDVSVAGRITDVDTGAPIRGAEISASSDEVNSDRRKLQELTTVTDDDGRYEVSGLPRRRGNRLSVAFSDQPYLAAEHLTVPRASSSGPTTFDVSFKRGVWVSGVVTDQQTGEPVKGRLCYTPFANNEFINQHPRYSNGIRRMLEHFPSGETDADGKYRILVLQGRGVVCFQAGDREAYVAGFGRETIPELANDEAGVLDHGVNVSFHGLKEINPAADAREVAADLQVDRGRTIAFRFVDVDGKRLTSVKTKGLKTQAKVSGETTEIKFASAGETRCLEFCDEQTGLRSIVRFTAEPNQTEATFTLHPPARVIGRLIDPDHQPLKDLPLDAHYRPQPGWVSSPPRTKSDPQPISGEDGRFTMVVPAGETLNVFIRSNIGVGKTLKTELTAAPGETIDLGDLEINTEDRSAAKPLQPEKRTRAPAQQAEAAKASPEGASTKTVAVVNDVAGTPAKDDKDDPVFHYAGTVVDETGQPVSGASIHFVNWRTADGQSALEVIATTEADGKFELSRKKSELGNAQEPDAWQYVDFIATKSGYGLAAGRAMNFETTGAAKASLSDQLRRATASLVGRETNVLRLPVDMPIKGQIITPDGKPVAGATVFVINFSEGTSGSLEDWEKATKEPGANYYTVRQKMRRVFGGDVVNGPIDRTIAPVTTDADGHFTLTGLGRERLARVFVTGPGIEASEFYVRSRSGDTIKLSDSERGEDSFLKSYYPAEFTHVSGPSQPVTGVVTDLKTGRPLAGFFVRAERTTASRIGGRSGYIRATTDEQGRFTLNGFPLGTGNEFVVLPPKGSQYLPAGLSFETTLSSEPLVKDVPLTEGILVRGKVSNAKTGKPVMGYAEYFVFTDNPALEQTKNFRVVDQRNIYTTDAEGRFEIPALPGPGIVTFWANDLQNYVRGQGRESITGKHASGVTYLFSTWPYHVMGDNYSSLTQIDPTPDAKSVDVNISLTPTQTFTGRVVAADGRAPTEYFLHGERSPASWYEGRGNSFTVIGYIPEYGRRLMAFEPSTDLIGRLDVTGEPPADAVITLGPATRFVGRLVDENGAPLPETRIEAGWRSANDPNAAMMNDRRWRGGFDPERGEFVPLKGRSVLTDENGRFELRGIMPGLKYSARATGVRKVGNESYPTSLGIVLDDVLALPGPVNDLGDVKLQQKKPAATTEEEATSKPVEEAQGPAIRGNVLNAEGKPLPGAHVAIIGTPNRPWRSGDYGGLHHETLAEGPVNERGEFKIDLQGNPLESHRALRIVAGGAGLGTAWNELDPAAGQPIEFQLQPEQLISVRLMDIDGHPVANVRAAIKTLRSREVSGTAGSAQGPGDNPPAAWPQTVVSDQDGLVTIRGVSAQCGVYLDIEPTDKCAPQSLGVNTGAPESRPSNDGTYRPQFRNAAAGELVTFALAPAQIFEGTVRYADTREPAPFARIAIASSQQPGGGSYISTSGTADESGRYRISANPGVHFHVDAYPPDGAPYLTPTLRDVRWTEGIAPKSLDFELPRGVMIRGTIVDAVSGAPEAGASIQYQPRDATEKMVGVEVITGWQGIQLSKADGSFEIVAAPGPGSLLVHGSAGKFVLQEIGERYLQYGQPGGWRTYAHAIMPLDPTIDTPLAPIRVELQPAVAVNGKLVNEAGDPISSALLLSRLRIHPTNPHWRAPFGEPERGGVFELAGLLSGREETVHFLDAKERLGATAVLKSDQPDPTIVLTPCGQAKARIVRADGTPVVGNAPQLDFIMTPGELRFGADSMKSTNLMADRDFNANVDHVNYRPPVKTDEQGLITYPALIPGATYQIIGHEKGREVLKHEFVAESGKTLDLGEIVMELPDD